MRRLESRFRLRRHRAGLIAACAGLFGAVLIVPQVSEAAPLDPVDFSLVADINDTSEESNIGTFLVDGDLVYFTADDGIHGDELWRYDESTGVAEMVADINPGVESSNPLPLLVHDGILYLRARVGSSGFELWKLDGSSVTLVKDAASGVTVSSPAGPVVLDGSVYFLAEGDGFGREVWTTDGTSAGTVRVSGIRTGSSASAQDLTVVPSLGGAPSRLYFRADDGSTGDELYRYTVAGGVVLLDLRAGSEPSSPRSLQAWGTSLLARAHTGVDDVSVFTADGSEVVGADVAEFAAAQPIIDVWGAGKNVFARTGAQADYDFEVLDVSDGSFTTLVEELAASSGVAVGDDLIFAARPGLGADVEIWMSDGTAPGTGELGTKPAGVVLSSTTLQLSTKKDRVFIRGASDGNNLLLSVLIGGSYEVLTEPSDGSVKRFVELTSGGLALSFGKLGDEELWATDKVGTPPELVIDINRSTQPSSPFALGAADAKLFFTASTAGEGPGLWTVDPGDVPKRIGDVGGSWISTNDDIAYFRGRGSNGFDQVWRSDGTVGGTNELFELFPIGNSEYPSDVVASASGVYFTAKADDQLWYSDSRVPNPVHVADVDRVSGAVVVGSRLLFRGADPVAGGGSALWWSDGTAAGTGPVEAFMPALTGASVVSESSSRVYLAAGGALWTTDGTVQGTVMVETLGEDSVRSVVETDAGIFIAGGRVNQNANRVPVVWFKGTGQARVIVHEAAIGETLSFGQVIGESVVYVHFSSSSEIEGFVSVTESTSRVISRTVHSDYRVSLAFSHGDVAYFAMTTESPTRLVLWGSDGTFDGTEALVTSSEDDSFETRIAGPVGDRVYVSTEPVGSPLGVELWQMDLPDLPADPDPDPAPDPDPEPDPDPTPDPDPDPTPDPDPAPDPTPDPVAGVSEVVSLTPGRVFASRMSDETVDGLFQGQGRIASGSFVQVDVRGRAGVSADAKSVVMNVTAINPSGRGFMTVYPCGDRPLASSLNFGAAGAVVGNEVVAKLSADGKLCVFTSAASDLTMDVVGFVPVSSDVVSVDPGRIYATRSADETVDGEQQAAGRLSAGAFAEVQVTGRAMVPASGVGSVVMNVTAINPSGRGFLTVYPCGDRPLASSLNFGAAGAVVGNELIAKLSATGTVCVYSSAATDLTVDVVGYVLQSSPVMSLDPARLYATRVGDVTFDGDQQATGRIAAGGFAEIKIAGRAGVPATGAGAVVMNITAINPSGRGFMTVYPCGDRPLASSLNFGAAGAVVGNELVAKLSSTGSVCVYSSAASDLTADVVGYIPT